MRRYTLVPLGAFAHLNDTDRRALLYTYAARPRQSGHGGGAALKIPHDPLALRARFSGDLPHHFPQPSAAAPIRPPGRALAYTVRPPVPLCAPSGTPAVAPRGTPNCALLYANNGVTF